MYLCRVGYAAFFTGLQHFFFITTSSGMNLKSSITVCTNLMDSNGNKRLTGNTQYDSKDLIEYNLGKLLSPKSVLQNLHLLNYLFECWFIRAINHIYQHFCIILFPRLLEARNTQVADTEAANTSLCARTNTSGAFIANFTTHACCGTRIRRNCSRVVMRFHLHQHFNLIFCKLIDRSIVHRMHRFDFANDLSTLFIEYEATRSDIDDVLTDDDWQKELFNEITNDGITINGTEYYTCPQIAKLNKQNNQGGIRFQNLGNQNIFVFGFSSNVCIRTCPTVR